MKYGENIAARRRIPVYLVDDAGEPANVSTPTGSQIQVSKSGDSWTNGTGTWGTVDAADGSYYYQATQDELTTGSFLLLRIAHPDARVFLFGEDIGDRVFQDAQESERRIAVYLFGEDGEPVVDGEDSPTCELSTNGGAFASLQDDTLTNIGGTNGGYYVTVSTSEVTVIGTRVLRITAPGALPFVYRFNVREAVDDDDDDDDVLTPVPAPTEVDDQELHDHAEHAISRLCEFTRVRSG